MAATWKKLGELVRQTRERKGLSRADVVQKLDPFIDDADLSNLETAAQRLRPEQVEAICRHLSLAEKHWRPLISTDSQSRKEFEQVLEELVGQRATLDHLDQSAADAADHILTTLLKESFTADQTLDLVNRLLVFYGMPRMTEAFFNRYLGPSAFSSTTRFLEAVRRYQVDAIRLYSNLSDAYRSLTAVDDPAELLQPLQKRLDDQYRRRTPWNAITQIAEERLPDLGYISAAAVRQERDERATLADFLHELANEIEKSGAAAVSNYAPSKLRRMDALLRKFSTIPHGFLSPLFVPDADALRREADRIGPKDEQDLSRMEQTQAHALKNLANYLTADYMDVYVATSMRSTADFVSVNRFVTALFDHKDVRALNLRYFNPTQSWIEDRVAKGLVEALMLKRADVTIYMAQKEDTFGKDSEASVALGQGKPVVVYVPRLFAPDLNIDSAELGSRTRQELENTVRTEALVPEDKDVDATFDNEALHSRILAIRLSRATNVHFADIARRHWADFDLYGETERLPDEAQRRMFRHWLDLIVQGGTTDLPASLHEPLRRMLVAVTMRFERRAQIFREIHPLALQVILSTGVLNGILVVRSVDACADLLVALIQNDLRLTLKIDENNYRAVEDRTGSTVRVIARHKLLSSAFASYYSRLRPA